MPFCGIGRAGARGKRMRVSAPRRAYAAPLSGGGNPATPGRGDEKKFHLS